MTPAAPAHHAAAARAERRHEPADFRAYAEHRDAHAHERLICAYLPLANAIARRFDRGDRVPLEDLQQIAALGLIKALDRFDPDNGAAFSSFAVPTIQGEIRRYFRDRSWTVRPPRDLQERAMRIEREREQLTTDLGRNPTAAELAQRLDCTLEDILDAAEATRARDSDSFDRPLSVNDGDDADTLAERLGAEDPASPPPKPPPRSTACSRRCPNATRSSCSCASARTSPKPKSAAASATRKCTSRASCAPPSPNSPTTHKPPTHRLPDRDERSSLTEAAAWRRPSISQLVARLRAHSAASKSAQRSGQGPWRERWPGAWRASD